MTLLCPRHHSDVHAGTWHIRLDTGGRIELTPPRHHDPSRTPRPPVFHTVSEALERLRYDVAPVP